MGRAKIWLLFTFMRVERLAAKEFPRVNRYPAPAGDATAQDAGLYPTKRQDMNGYGSGIQLWEMRLRMLGH
jgi:hypothetical protein